MEDSIRTTPEMVSGADREHRNTHYTQERREAPHPYYQKQVRLETHK